MIIHVVKIQCYAYGTIINDTYNAGKYLPGTTIDDDEQIELVVWWTLQDKHISRPSREKPDKSAYSNCHL